VEELIPLGSGLLLGAVLGLLKPSLRLPLGAALAVALGILATVVTGESKISWSYVLIDVPIVAVAAVLGLLAGRSLSPAPQRRAG
jgi:xanthosine utilization system XapX-like protein